jgi:hypothetical protein
VRREGEALLKQSKKGTRTVLICSVGRFVNTCMCGQRSRGRRHYVIQHEIETITTLYGIERSFAYRYKSKRRLIVCLTLPQTNGAGGK